MQKNLLKEIVFFHSAKGQVDGLRDKSLMRYELTTQKQYTWGGGLVFFATFSEYLKRDRQAPKWAQSGVTLTTAYQGQTG